MPLRIIHSRTQQLVLSNLTLCSSQSDHCAQLDARIGFAKRHVFLPATIILFLLNVTIGFAKPRLFLPSSIIYFFSTWESVLLNLTLKLPQHAHLSLPWAIFMTHFFFFAQTWPKPIYLVTMAWLSAVNFYLIYLQYLWRVLGENLDFLQNLWRVQY